MDTMVAHAALAVVAALVITGSAGAAVATGIIHTGGADTFDLGTLSPGQSGNVTISTSVDLNSSGLYHLSMEKEDHIGNTFSMFALSVAVNGTTYNLSNGEQDNSGMNLSAGNYTFDITLHYAVRNNVISSNESNVPFLFLHKSDNFGDANHDGQFNGTGVNDSAVVIHSSDSNMSQQNAHANHALAYITFNVNGNVGQQGDDNSGTDNVFIRELA